MYSGLIFFENYVTIAFIWETDVQLFQGREPLELISFVKGTVALLACAAVFIVERVLVFI